MKHNEETKAKLREAWKKRRLVFVPPMKGKKMSEGSRRLMSEAAKNRPSNRTGKKHTAETKSLISEKVKAVVARGPDHHAYSHGKAQRSLCDRRTVEYKRWRDAVFARDRYTCQKCGDDKGGNLRAHHLKPFADFIELRLEVSNGVTLCHDCHELEHSKPDSTRNLRKAKRGKTLY
jgi:5-methylcytosine-specific restriction endonuclease McrA